MMNVSRNNGSGDCTVPDKRKLIVNYIPQSTSEEDLTIIFGQVGQLESVRIMRDPHTGYSFGYGFVKYTNEGSAAAAITSFNGLKYQNKFLKVSYSRPPGQATKDANLYISNLPRSFTDVDLVNMFGKYGEIIQKNLLRDKATGLPRGVAFVRFARGDEAQAAINELNGLRLENGSAPLNVRVADDHTKPRCCAMEPQMHMCSRSGCLAAVRNTCPVFPPRPLLNQRTFHPHRCMGGGDYVPFTDMFW